MSAEEAWKAWWDAEGKRMERLPHHDAMDHMASVTRIAWLNGAFEAADEIERLRAERDEARRKICEIESQCICDPPRSPQKYASLFGWDCFKENTND